MPYRYILDSFAFLAYLQDEPGAAEVERLLAAAARGEAEVAMSVVNLGEAAYITEREQSLEAAQGMLAAFDQLSIRLVDADRALALDAAHVKAHQRLSYADAFVVALARCLDAVVVTGDPEFGQVEQLVPVHWLPR
ncbi:MAG: type II toxin-antitoxin system VapC family toxin [Lentisphaeria bacterium]|nr:type II toxin-antitoxin system VapC family toxin [Lentisphaeria bacterium]